MATVLLKSQIISQTTLTFDEDHKHFFFIIEYDQNLLTKLKCYNKSNLHYNTYVFTLICLQIGDSFGINDPFSQAGAQQQQQQQANVMPLQKPPKWLRKPAGASFGVSV